jgi:hypothetical protein
MFTKNENKSVMPVRVSKIFQIILKNFSKAEK